MMIADRLLARRVAGLSLWWRRAPLSVLSTSPPGTVFSDRAFESVKGISAATSVALYDEFNFRLMTHVQAAAVPAALTGEDLFVRARTGSGKTIAFLVPLVERLKKYQRVFERTRLERQAQARQLALVKQELTRRRERVGYASALSVPPAKVTVGGELVDITDLPYVYSSPPPLGLILVPTRELGMQVAEEAKRLCALHTNFQVAVFVGGRRIEGDRKKVEYMLNGAASMNMADRIMVCTPGRLLEHLRDTRGFREMCAGVKMLVIDESDRILDMGFHRDVADILVEIAKAQVGLERKLVAARAECAAHLERLRPYMGRSAAAALPLGDSRPRLSSRASYADEAPDPVREFDHQTLMFSATISTKVLEIANSILRPGYKYIDAIEGSEGTDALSADGAGDGGKFAGKEALYRAVRAAELAGEGSGGAEEEALARPLRQTLFSARDGQQLEVLVAVLLRHIRERPTDYKIIVFTPTSRHAAFLAEFVLALRDVGQSVIDIHSKMTQPKRQRASDKFRSSRGIIMFSSDVSARGMDYPDVSLVVQLGLVTRNQYTHRIGRTARVDKEGEGALICTPYELPVLERELSGLIAEEDIVRHAEDLSFVGAHDSGDIGSSVRKVGALRDTIGQALGQTGKTLQRLAQQATTSWLGFYALEVDRLSWGKVDLVTHGQAFCASLGLKEFPDLTPRTIYALKLQDTALGSIQLKHISDKAAVRPYPKRGKSISAPSSKMWRETKSLLDFGRGAAKGKKRAGD